LGTAVLNSVSLITLEIKGISQDWANLFIESHRSTEKSATSSAIKGVETKSLHQDMGTVEISFIETETVQQKVRKCTLLQILHKLNMLKMEVLHVKVCLFAPTYDQYRRTSDNNKALILLYVVQRVHFVVPLHGSLNANF
jgi:hypothetical protein